MQTFIYNRVISSYKQTRQAKPTGTVRRDAIKKKEKKKMATDKMLEIGYLTEEMKFIPITEITTNRSMTVFEALDICGVDMDEWA